MLRSLTSVVPGARNRSLRVARKVGPRVRGVPWQAVRSAGRDGRPALAEGVSISRPERSSLKASPSGVGDIGGARSAHTCKTGRRRQSLLERPDRLDAPLVALLLPEGGERPRAAGGALRADDAHQHA